MVISPRIYWLDWLKLFAMFLVVWGHALFHFADIPYEEKYVGVSGFIYSFHMPLFMTLSGYFSYKLMLGLGDLKKKFIQLIVPLCSLLLFCFLFGIKDQNFWYLPSLFICYLIFYCFFKISLSNKVKILFLLLLLVLFSPLIVRIPYVRLYKIDYMLPFFGMGLLLKRYQKVIENSSKYILLPLGVLFVLLEFFWNSSFVWYSSFPNWIDYKQLILNKELCFDIRNLGYSLYRYIVGAVGTGFFFLLFFELSKKIQWSSEPVNKFALGYTMQIYVLQTFFVQENVCHIQVPMENMFLYQYVYTFFVSILIVVVCILCAKLMEKSKIVSLLFFGVNKFK